MSTASIIKSVQTRSATTYVNFISDVAVWERQSRAEQSRAQRSRQKKLIAVSERRGILPLEGLVDTLRPICMSITPTEKPISAPRLSGAVALNIGGEAEH